MRRGILECGLDVAGKRVLLKPNFVEFDPNTCINTDVAVVAAALDVFRSLGAAEVRIGEGPGHRRDTFAIAELTRYRSEIPQFDDVFVDLNRDDVSPVQGFADRKEFYFPNSVLARRPDRFARQDEDSSLGRGDALDEELSSAWSRARSTAGLRMSCTISASAIRSSN